MPKVKKQQETNINPLAQALELIKSHPALQPPKSEADAQKADTGKMVDIITFCERPDLLALPANNFNLWISQRVILKCFYMGTIGNEALTLTQEEWEWIYSQEEDKELEGFLYKKNIKDVVRKMHRRIRDKDMSYFKELHLVLGRRSGKSILASIITAYEVYKLIVINDGDPHAYYNLPADDEIAIINVALALQQAGRLFGYTQSRIRNSPFFKPYIAKETTTEIRFYTRKDLEKKAKGDSVLSVPGSILLLCGHSNPDSLAGYNAIMILFDEIAFYDESGKVTGSDFYRRLKPSLAKFFKYNAARVIQISSPSVRSGIFYEHAMDAAKDDDIGNSILSFQLPTWEMSPEVPYSEIELVRERLSNLEFFVVEYGAQWAESGAMSNYFDSAAIDNVIRGELGPHLRPEPGFNYYIHVDPAKNSANYAAVMVAKRKYTNNQGRRRNFCVLAGIWVWRPIAGKGLLFSEIDKEIIQICSIFHPISVTYDDYQSVQSIQLLRSHGINVSMVPYNRNVKAKLYQNLRDLMYYQPNPELLLYNNGGDSNLLICELKNLKQKQNQRGMTITPDKNADVKSDDIADCLAGACSSACEALRMGLPEPVLVHTGYS